MTSDIPSLSIRQPWAELIMLGRKTIELRSWPTGYRGPVWIHTGLRGDEKLEKNFGFSNLFKGGYIGIVNLDAVVPIDNERWLVWQAMHLHPGGYQPGLYAWVLSSPHRLKEHISAPGQLGLFSPSEETAMKLKDAILD